MKTKVDNLDIKKKAFLDSYQKTLGNITLSCQIIGITRNAFYKWTKEKEFKEAFDSIEPDELIIDLAESALLEKIKSGDTTAIIFTLKTKGKKRGYVEKQEIDHTTNGKEITLIQREIVNPKNTNS